MARSLPSSRRLKWGITAGLTVVGAIGIACFFYARIPAETFTKGVPGEPDAVRHPFQLPLEVLMATNGGRASHLFGVQAGAKSDYLSCELFVRGLRCKRFGVSEQQLDAWWRGPMRTRSRVWGGEGAYPDGEWQSPAYVPFTNATSLGLGRGFILHEGKGLGGWPRGASVYANGSYFEVRGEGDASTLERRDPDQSRHDLPLREMLPGDITHIRDAEIVGFGVALTVQTSSATDWNTVWFPLSAEGALGPRATIPSGKSCRAGRFRAFDGNQELTFVDAETMRLVRALPFAGSKLGYGSDFPGRIPFHCSSSGAVIGLDGRRLCSPLHDRCWTDDFDASVDLVGDRVVQAGRVSGRLQIRVGASQLGSLGEVEEPNIEIDQDPFVLGGDEVALVFARRRWGWVGVRVTPDGEVGVIDVEME